MAAYRARLSNAQFLVLREKATEPGHTVNRANGGFDDVRFAERSITEVTVSSGEFSAFLCVNIVGDEGASRPHQP